MQKSIPPKSQSERGISWHVRAWVCVEAAFVEREGGNGGADDDGGEQLADGGGGGGRGGGDTAAALLKQLQKRSPHLTLFIGPCSI